MAEYSCYANNILSKIVDEIKEIPDDKFYRNEDQYYRAGVDEGVNRAIEIIMKYYD